MFGACLAVLCAFTWSVSIILFKKAGAEIHPVLLNLLKNSVALLLLIPTVLVIEGSFFPQVTPTDLAKLLFSGLLGIGLADAMVLKALQEIGASRVAVVECVYSPFVIFLSVAFLGESISWTRVFGAAMVMTAIACVSLTPSLGDVPRAKILSGVRWGIMGLFSMAAGIVMVKPILAHVPLFWLICVRLLAGVAASIVLFAFLPQKKALLRGLTQLERKGMIAFACVLSTYVSMMLWVAGFKFQDASVAAVLNQTSTIFTVILAAVVLGEKMTLPKIVGTALALAGVLTMTLG